MESSASGITPNFFNSFENEANARLDPPRRQVPYQLELGLQGPAAILPLNGESTGELYVCFWAAFDPQPNGARQWQDGRVEPWFHPCRIEPE